jgi:hypothetical protein
VAVDAMQAGIHLGGGWWFVILPLTMALVTLLLAKEHMLGRRNEPPGPTQSWG